MTWDVLEGDCLELMPTLAESSVDAIVTDPPYGLEFMGKEWDHGIPGVPFWTQALRVLKPGGHLLAFGGTRTYHRLTCAIEDAGFEVRDCLAWLYGSGFPKSLDVSKAIDRAAGSERSKVPGGGVGTDRGYSGGFEPGMSRSPDPITEEARRWQGWGTALKPAFEPIVMARKPLSERNVTANVERWGTGALNIDGCRVEGAPPSVPQPRFGSPTGQVYGFQAGEGRNGEMSTASGRWPANVLLDEEAAAMVDEQSGERPGGQYPVARGMPVATAFAGGQVTEGGPRAMGDSGGASRFFYVAKADRAERNNGLEHLSPQSVHPPSGDDRVWDIPGSKSTHRANHHPTVKPVELMQHLVRLVTPKAGLVLDPFTGSGSTGIAALREGFRFLGIEREAGYAEIARARIEGDAPLFNTRGL